MSKRLYWVLAGIAALSFLGTLALYPGMPVLVPSHWNFRDQMDGLAPKWLNLVLGAIPLLLIIGLAAVPKIDPRGGNFKKHPKAWGAIAIALTLFLAAFSWLVNLAAYGYFLPVSKVIVIGLGVTLVVLGNFMPQLRSNFFAGIRTPWALTDDHVWRKTQRAGGIVFVIGGLLMILCAFFAHFSEIVIFAPLIFIILGMVGVYIYSYLLYRGRKTQPGPDGPDKPEP